MTTMMTMAPARRVRKERRVAVLLKVSETTNWIPHAHQHNINRCSFASLLGDDDDDDDDTSKKSKKGKKGGRAPEGKWSNQLNTTCPSTQY